MATRLTWESPGFQLHIFTDAQLQQPQALNRLQELASKAVILLSIQVQQDSAVQVSALVSSCVQSCHLCAAAGSLQPAALLRACCLCSLFSQQAMALLCAEGSRLCPRHAACAAGSAYSQPSFCVPRVAALLLQVMLPLMQQVPTAIALDSAAPLERMTRLNNKAIAGNAWAEASAAVLPW